MLVTRKLEKITGLDPLNLSISSRIKEFYDATGEIPTVKDCDGEILPYYYKVKAAGGLRHILASLGIFENKKGKLISSLIRYRDEYGVWPKSRDCQECEYLMSHNRFVETFGSWNESINIAKRKYKK